MNELQFPVLYIDDTANPHAILSFLCQSGYYCLILTDFLAEFETKCGRMFKRVTGYTPNEFRSQN